MNATDNALWTRGTIRWTVLAAALTLACGKTPPPELADAGDGGNDDAGFDAGPVYDGGLGARLANTRFGVAEHMLASVEMQLSGEPFAELLGYDLAGFSRTISLTDQYTDPTDGVQRTDPLGYALAVESYEYSKQPMNNLSFESGAGLSLAFGPILNPSQEAGDAGFILLEERFQHFALMANAGGTAGSNLIMSPPPAFNPYNYLGWPGLWPIFAEFSSFDPTISPMPGGVITSCSFNGSVGSLGYGGPPTLRIANYECDYNSLHLPDRETQVTKTLEPGALGYATWKQGLWSITYWGTMQDTAGNPITDVAPADQPNVGQPGNTVVGNYPDPNDPTGTQLLMGAPGVFLGDIPMEGWQGLTMMEEIDNKAALVLQSLLSSDGTTLQGVASVLAADNYSYDSPLLYFPASVAVTESHPANGTLLDDKFFPQPTGFSIANPDSRLADLSGILGGFSEAFAFTDRNNPDVGGSIPFLVTFDGDPFPQDNGLADGEATLHDRALGVLKIALVDLDRLHFDPNAKVLVDTVSLSNGTPTRGQTVSTVELVKSIIAMRNAFRSLAGSLQLYSNDTPDTLGGPSALSATALTGASYNGTLADRLNALIHFEADFLTQNLVAADGSVSNGYDLAAQAKDPSATTLDVEAAAIRGLLEAYLATSDQQYRDRAMDVYADLIARFWMDDVRCFRTTAGVDDQMQFTPIRFGMLTGALRQYFKLVASNPSRQSEGTALLQRLKRSYKLVINGWDDRNQDDSIQYPDECLGVGLEMGERALTGELGHYGDKGDGDKDCVKEISYVSLPAALGGEIDIFRK